MNAPNAQNPNDNGQSSGLILPPEMMKPEIKTVLMGGLNIAYQANPRLHVSVDSRVLQSQPQLLALLSELMNCRDSLVRECLDLREQIEELRAQAPTAELREPTLASTGVEESVDNASEADDTAG